MLEYRSENFHVQVHAPPSDAAKEVLTTDALRFVGYMCHTFHERRQNLLSVRKQRAKEFDAGETPKFLSIPAVQDPNWKCAAIPPDVQDRRVEITGPVDRKMVINGLNSGACVYMADFEDSTSPTWKNLTEGQLNLRDAVQGTISYTSSCTGKHYALGTKTSVLFVRPRGWHLDEAHVTVNGKLASGSIFDFALYLFHNAQRLIAKGSRPYFYLPKLESHLEARLWNDVFVAAQQYLGLPIGTIRATVLLETITASFEMEEILYELRDHSLGLNCGRWDYLFSYIKKFKLHADKVAPDRCCLTMSTPLMEAYCKRVIHICHKRGTFAIGGMSAVIPRKDDKKKNEMSLKQVAMDKEREVILGHDGTWVSHPALVKCARGIFDGRMFSSNQIESKPMLDGANVTEEDLLRLPEVPEGSAITSKGLKCGVKIVLHYTEAWLRGVGCIPLNHKMEDAATAEISRAQIWQWRHFGVKTQDDGVVVTSHRISSLVDEEVERQRGGKWKLAGKLLQFFLGPADSTRRYVWFIGNDLSCSVLGAITQFSWATHLYSSCLSFYFLMTVRYGIRDEVFAKKYEPWVHASILIFSTSTAIAGFAMGIYHENEVGPTCWIGSKPGEDCSNDSCGAEMLAWLFGGIPNVFVLSSVTINNLILYCYVRKTIATSLKNAREAERRLAQYQSQGEIQMASSSIRDLSYTGGKRDSSTESNRDLSRKSLFSLKTNQKSVLRSSDKQRQRVREVGMQSFLYVMTYLLCFGPTMAKQTLDGRGIERQEGSGKYFLPLLFLQSVLLPSQGTFYCIIFFRPKYLKNRQKNPNKTRLWAARSAFETEKKKTVRIQDPVMNRPVEMAVEQIPRVKSYPPAGEAKDDVENGDDAGSLSALSDASSVDSVMPSVANSAEAASTPSQNRRSIASLFSGGGERRANASSSEVTTLVSYVSDAKLSLASSVAENNTIAPNTPAATSNEAKGNYIRVDGIDVPVNSSLYST